ncbi:MAG TPA: hypothetical protein DCM26_05865 [Desulfotomaculum sp.]|jgi:peptidoglycan biosynthesis protein MviN/MurJ (putative lipid II flippase)|nr:hypothetical protein [Desulfotomaculum sp.]
MFFIITALAAIVATIIWYVNAPEDKYKLSLLSFIFWGATLMWFVDHVMAYLIEGGEFFEITLDATLLGVTVVLFGLLVWMIVLLVSDPKGVFKKLLKG